MIIKQLKQNTTSKLYIDQKKNKAMACSLHRVVQFGIINSESQIICTE